MVEEQMAAAKASLAKTNDAYLQGWNEWVTRAGNMGDVVRKFESLADFVTPALLGTNIMPGVAVPRKQFVKMIAFYRECSSN